MKNIIQKITLLVVGCVLLAYGLLYFNQRESYGTTKYQLADRLCLVRNIYTGHADDPLCNFDVVASTFFNTSISLILVSVMLLFVKATTYESWKRFALWMIPITIFIISIAPASSPGGWISGPDFDKGTVSWLFSILFLVISLIIIAKQSLSRPPAK